MIVQCLNISVDTRLALYFDPLVFTGKAMIFAGRVSHERPVNLVAQGH